MTTVVVGSVSAAELSAQAADRPMFVGNNVLADKFATAVWKTGTATWASGSNVTDPSYPTKFLFDGMGLPQSKPVYSAVNAYTLLFNLNAGIDGLHSIDSVMVWSHNLASLSGTITVTVQVADDNAFSTNLRTLVTMTVANARRLWSTSLGTNGRYTNVQWLRIVISTTAGSFGAAPAIGEVIIGRRRVMALPPATPWEEQGIESDTVEHRSRSGVISRYVRQRALRRFDPTFRMNGHDNVRGIDSASELRSMWRECQFGTRSFIFDPNPTSNEQPAVVLADPVIQSVPLVGVFERECRLPMFELPPYIAVEPAIPVFLDGHSLDLPTFSIPSSSRAVKTSPTGLNVTSSISISVWFKNISALSRGTEVPCQICMHADSSGSLNWWLCLIQDSGGSSSPGGSNMIQFRVGAPHISEWACPTTTFASNTWYHLLVIGTQSGQSKCYLNGTLLTLANFSTPTAANFTNPSVAFSVGDRNDGSYPIAPARIDDLAIFIDSDKSSEHSRYAAGPLDMTLEAGISHFYSFESSPNDLVGSNHLTLSNGAAYSTDHP